MMLRELLGAPELDLRLHHGDARALDRPVRWVYSTDLPDPGRYLSGGELVVSGLVWRRTPEDSERFVAACAAAGAVALAAGEAMFHGVPPDVVEACRRHDLPLLSVPEHVSFSALTELVVGRVTAWRGAQLAATLDRQRQLLQAVAEGRSLDEVVALVCAETGLTCRVITATGRAVVHGPQALPLEDLDRVTRAFLTADRLPAVVAADERGSGAPYSVFPVGPALGQRMTSWFVVVEGIWSTWEPDVADAVGQLAVIAALDRARRDEGLRASRHIADEAVGLVERGAGGQPETQVRLRQAGVSGQAPLAVAVAEFPGRPDLAEVSRSVLDDAAAQLGTPVVGTTGDGRAVALLCTADPAFADVLRTALARLAPALGQARLTVGISEPSDPAALSGALEEARHARRLAELRTDRVSVVTGLEVTSYVLLLATVPDDVRRTFASRVLGPVLEYDARHGAGLRATLEAFLDCSGSWSRAADALHLHVNTVRYRIARVEELTGRDLSRLEDRVDVFLALRSVQPGRVR
jgi:hypothetical protein